MAKLTLLLSDDPFRRPRDDDDPEDAPREEQWIPRSHLAVPDLVCVHFPAGDSFLWFEFDAQVGAHDFELIEIGEEIGVPDHRIQGEVEQVGWEDMIGFEWKREMHRGYDFGIGKRQWALENGIAPGQPFCVRFGLPKYSGRGEDVDVEYDVEVVRVMPMDPVLVAERWRMALLKTNEERDDYADRHEEWKRRHRTDMSGLYLRLGSYYPNGYYDEMSPPTGIRFTLTSKLPDGAQWNTASLVSADSDKGSHAEAKDLLFAKAVEIFPKLTRERFDALRIDRSW